MSTRVCSPPSSSIMDIPRDIQGCPSHGNPTSGSLPVPSSTQSSSSPQNPIFGSSSSSSGHQVTLTVRSNNVARSLFGPPDPRSAQYARDKVKEIRERDKQKWNFDFDNEKPLEGRYKWESMNSTSGSSSAQVSKVYGLSGFPFIYSQSETATSAANAALNERQPLLTCFPPTPVKSYPDDRNTLLNRLPVTKNNASSSSISSQSSPETSTNVLEHNHSFLSPPSSLEEGSSSPVEDEPTEAKSLISSSRIRSKTSKISSSQPPITQFLQTRKRPAHTRTTSPSAEKKAAL